MHYPGNAGTPTANLLTVKLLINSIISTEGAKLMTMDIMDFYLHTPMARFEYMRLCSKNDSPPKQDDARSLDARLPSHQFLPRRRQFWSEICRGGARAISVRHGKKILQVLMQLGRGTLLRTHHKMGLQGTKGPPLNAGISPQGTALF